jgi:transcriptional regulator with XRE-family HTH domain
MITFGKMISHARKALGISQKNLASRIKKEDGASISAQYLNDIEHDRRNAPSEFLISQLAEELGLSKDHLCLAAGTIPADVKENVAAAKTETVDAAFSAFRRAVKRAT